MIMDSTFRERFKTSYNTILDEIKDYAIDHPNGKFNVPMHMQFILDQFNKVANLVESIFDDLQLTDVICEKMSTLATKTDLYSIKESLKMNNLQQTLLEKLGNMENNIIQNIDEGTKNTSNKIVLEKLNMIQDNINPDTQFDIIKKLKEIEDKTIEKVGIDISNTIEKINEDNNKIMKNYTSQQQINLAESTLNEILQNQNRLYDKIGKIESLCNIDSKPFKTYSQVLKAGAPIVGSKSKLQNPNLEVLLLYSTEEGISSYQIRQLLYDHIKPSALGIGIDRLKNIRGGVALEIGNSEDANKLEHFIKKEMPQIIIRKPKKKLPHLAIYSVPSELTREEIPLCIYHQNELFGEYFSEDEFMDNFKIKFRLGKKGKNYNNWVIQVSPQIRIQLLKFDKTSVQWSKCRISDFFPVLQCLHCCRFGHLSSSCSQEDPTCSHCSGNHSFRDCTNKDKPAICCNCKHEGSSVSGHNARDSSCKLYTRIKNNLIQQTDYGTTY
ncbi:uncharacterized protein LOC111612967 [Centruroides sculpturatus]|uniref:uncharacterized protein LOC111612967 n=1 Tax=Centruroides sculpturatus TaxID=218467 RepID=UPI000C6D673C|nr:uncharacterized protein LOC111612967 [Centruroides sculpturatus]